MKLSIINEENISGVFRRFLNMVRGKPGFGVGTNPKDWGEVKEIIQVTGVPAIDFQGEWDKAIENEDTNHKKALKIYKKLADKNPISGLRSKSYFTRIKEDNRLHIVIDVDNMKDLNTKLGHRGTDSVLRKFGELIQHHLEDNVNETYGKISKVYHRTGDEFNAIINIDDIPDLKPLIQYLIDQSNQVLRKFSSIHFKNEIGESRATATIGIGFNEKETDKIVDNNKIARRKFKPGSKIKHLFLGPKVSSIIQS
jgi:GGDEF domain-containing protein